MTRKVHDMGSLGLALNLYPGIEDKPKGVYVHVYRNFHRNCWSVRYRGRVIFLADNIKLEDCSFRIQPAGQARVRRGGVKNVHAYIKGRLTHNMADTKWNEYVGGHRGVTYNPYQDNWFMQVYERGDGMRILSPIKKCRSRWPSVQFHSTGQVSGDPW